MKKIIFYFILIFMLAACGEKTNFQGKYEQQETGETLWTTEEEFIKKLNNFRASKN